MREFFLVERNEFSDCHSAIDQLHNQEDFDRWNRRASPWQPIDTAPNRMVVLFFGITCRREDGSASDWKIATGVRYKNEGDDGDDVFEWDGRKLKSGGMKPTHWLELPDPPEVEE